jgi:hypothetical protein
MAAEGSMVDLLFHAARQSSQLKCCIFWLGRVDVITVIQLTIKLITFVTHFRIYCSLLQIKSCPCA